MAILNFYQSFWEKLLEKIQNSHFWPFQIYTSLFGKNCWKKFGTAIFGHSEFIPVFLGELSKKIPNSHFWPFQIYTTLFGKNCWNKFGTAIFGHSEFISVFLGKIVGKNSEWPFLAIPNFTSLFGKIVRKNLEWPFQIYISLFGENCWKKFETAIFGHSEFIPVFLGKLSKIIPNSHFWPF